MQRTTMAELPHAVAAMTATSGPRPPASRRWLSTTARPASGRGRPADDRPAAGVMITGRGQGSAIGTLVERTTRYVHLIHLPHGWKAPQVHNALITQTRTSRPSCGGR